MENSANAIVERLTEHINGSNRNITTDNWFTSVPLAKSLKSKKLTLIGTIAKNKRELPAEFRSDKGRPVGSSMFGFESDCTIVSYIPKRKINVLLFSTAHGDDRVSKENGLPEIIEACNDTKGGIDVVDKLCSSYNCARSTRRWPNVIFFSMMNVAAINAFVKFTANDPNSNILRRDFLPQLPMSLAQDYMKQRASCSSIPKTLKPRIRELSGLPDSTLPNARESDEHRRCFY
ncbi:hypothetical protein NQ314_010143 [Rhamnusium bicolor]|uniref:PiggyBac transposable element-derived protein domain-containing protein n=1 Tax=Rhamnusium bicolor TaxID=1586634 RepID=A0AAV8XUP3_9CUCU|nr:hypothetical protein NQ314_010143 [Rhamnusium bicolor]